MTWLNRFDAAARAKTRLPEGWHGHLYTRVGTAPAFDGITILGAVYGSEWDDRVRATECKVFVSAADIAAVREPPSAPLPETGGVSSHPSASGARQEEV